MQQNALAAEEGDIGDRFKKDIYSSHFVPLFNMAALCHDYFLLRTPSSVLHGLAESRRNHP